MIPTFYKPSFFDDPDTSDYRLWKTYKHNNKKFSTSKIYEGTLFRKCKNPEIKYKNRFFILFEDRLGYYKNEADTKERSYCEVLNMKLQILPPSKEQSDIFGFKLIRNGQQTELYARTKEQQEKWISVLKQFCILTNFNVLYHNIKVLGKGRFAEVRWVKRKADNADFAVKTFSKNSLTTADKSQASIINEINIMRKVVQDNIIILYEVHENDSSIFLVLEFLKGGDLHERLKKGIYCEKEACIVMKKILTALDFLHGQGIMHRDLKLDNILLKDKENDLDIKLADFGLAACASQGELLFIRCGTPGYVAPEILNNEKYDYKVDIFSAGVILYMLLTGTPPFFGSLSELLLKNKNCEIDFNLQELGFQVSEHCIDILKKMLAHDPADRVTAHEALQHRWIINEGNFEPNVNANTVNGEQDLKKFQEEHNFNVQDLNWALLSSTPVYNTNAHAHYGVNGGNGVHPSPNNIHSLSKLNNSPEMGKAHHSGKEETKKHLDPDDESIIDAYNCSPITNPSTNNTPSARLNDIPLRFDTLTNKIQKEGLMPYVASAGGFTPRSRPSPITFEDEKSIKPHKTNKVRNNLLKLEDKLRGSLELISELSPQ
jgi:calcium-dependent protein kinase